MLSSRCRSIPPSSLGVCALQITEFPEGMALLRASSFFFFFELDPAVLLFVLARNWHGFRSITATKTKKGEESFPTCPSSIALTKKVSSCWAALQLVYPASRLVMAESVRRWRVLQRDWLGALQLIMLRGAQTKLLPQKKKKKIPF